MLSTAFFGGFPSALRSYRIRAMEETAIFTAMNTARVQVSIYPHSTGIFSIHPENRGYRFLIQITAAIPQKKQ